METRARHIAVGAFVLALCLGIGLFSIWVAKFQGQVTYVPYYTRFAGSVAQLRVDSTVTFGGIPVGRVQDIRIDAENSELARVDFVVRYGTPIRTDSQVTLELQSIAGGIGMQISRGTSDLQILPPGSEVKAGASTMEKLVKQAPDLLAKLQEIADNFNRMLNDENRAALTETLANLRDLSADLKSHTVQIDSLLDSGNTAVKTFADAGTEFRSLAVELRKSSGKMTNDASQAMKSIQQMSTAFNATADQISSILAENREPLKQFTGTTLYEASDLVAQLRQLAASMARISQEIERDPARFFLSDRNKGYQPQ
jgi:phospholipid/cholesterol/gamma-HCH transport system substrate-binding protein